MNVRHLPACTSSHCVCMCTCASLGMRVALHTATLLLVEGRKDGIVSPFFTGYAILCSDESLSIDPTSSTFLLQSSFSLPFTKKKGMSLSLRKNRTRSKCTNIVSSEALGPEPMMCCKRKTYYRERKLSFFLFQMRPRISIRGSVRPSIHPSVGRSVVRKSRKLPGNCIESLKNEV